MIPEKKPVHLPGWMKAAAGYMLLDTLCAGAGMGVPIFNIGLGFITGWIIGYRRVKDEALFWHLSGTLIKGAVLTSSFTVLLMAVIWLPAVKMLFDPAADLAGFGIPLIFFQPRASFIGWLVLMIGISPFLQVLTTVFGGTVAIWTAGFKHIA